ncbi:amidohydrolase family protein [Parasphingopyxis lamellibrachiae]|uniref:Amidohydrolase family protein n=1 Tax=Parasphingopyxis lamellibrachiae TaxID=680125 RepID=A0A3D9FG14_9SPHN|nr:amidohydrolase family protein [Parasphingopyxis lamellibrachiae]RED16588.1 amidohydrolase family protein [Parasphingopyxis lamellibrachiae]
MFKYLLLATVALAAPAAAEMREYRVLSGGNDVGHLNADVEAGRVVIDYDYKNNGRGPTIAETITLDDNGMPTGWTVEGASTFGNPVDETFSWSNGDAAWRDATGEGAAAASDAQFYIPQGGSPWSLALLARALLADNDHSFDVLPGGTASLTPHATSTFEGPDGPVEATTYEIAGLDLNPSYVMLDGDGVLFAVASPRFAIIRAGYEAADAALRDYAQTLSTERFVRIQAESARNFEGPVRVRNVQVFNPETMTREGPYDVVWYGERISSVQPGGSPVTEGETVIDGAGGTLVPGMYEMHGHISQNVALLNIAAGVTSVRDMGNETDVLEGLMDRIADGTIAGPRITRSGFIEGLSEFSSQTGELVSTEEEALAQVRWYAARGFHQVKLYNSMTPDWAPTLVAEAHRLGLRVAGHVPAFSNANAMIEAGFDELTHINQVMLGWVLEPHEDTRTLLRLTALDRLPALDLDSAPVQHTINLMAENNIAIDPTITIHESLLLSRNGEISPSFADIFDHMPIGQQRSLQQAWSDVSAEGADERFRGAFDQIIRTVTMMRERGILIVPGTDMGGSFAYHRELELFERAGYTAPEVLSLATLGMAEYLGQDEDLGSIEGGNYADFFLVPGDPTTDLGAIKSIAMVVANGTIYFPSDIYPHFGIRPFADAPSVTEAE